MVSGTRPAEHLYKLRKFHKVFGGSIPAQISDFNLDAGLTMPDQEKDQAYTECTGYTVADILTDIWKKPCSPDFNYSTALFLDGDAPGTNGASFHAALESAVVFGGLPKELAKINAATNGELFISNWWNWTDAEKLAAFPNRQNGVLDVLGNGDAFNSILSAMYTGKISISIGSPWFEEWYQDNSNHTGIVNMPIIDGSYPSWHNWKICGLKTINGIQYLIGKTWQGASVGDNGWLYFSRDVINAALSVYGSGALTINPNAERWWSFLSIILRRNPALLTSSILW